MAFQYAHHRPLTPITPVHSPHPSNGSSIRTRTPGQLSLHDYRKQQVTPSPPAIEGQKLVKKKRAASGLNRSERTPAESASPELYPSFHTLSTPPLTPSLMAPMDLTLHSLPNASATRRDTVIPEFSHLSFTQTTRQHQQKNSLEREDAPLLGTSDSPSSFSHFLPPSPQLEESSPTHFLSSIFPFTHTTVKPAQGGYHALGGKTSEESKRPTSRLVNFDHISPGFGKPKRENTTQHTSTYTTSGSVTGLQRDPSEEKISGGSRVPWYVLSARLPGIGKAVESFEGKEEQSVGLLSKDNSASIHTQNLNLFDPEGLSNSRSEKRSQPAKQVHGDVQPRERHFKSIKRLPHPQGELNTKRRPAPLEFSSYKGKPLAPPASVQTSSASTLSLSNFNFPQPPVASRTGARAKHVTFGLETELLSLTSTPTLIHHRGTSFELLNPHDSLRLSDIRTPLEIEDSDYFSAPLTALLASSKMADNTPPPEQKKPHTQLFESVTEAYKNIRKKSGPFMDTTESPRTPLDETSGAKEDHRGRWIPQSVNTDSSLGRDMTPEERTQRVKQYQEQMTKANRPSTPTQLLPQAISKRGSSLFKALLGKGPQGGLDGAQDELEYDGYDAEAGAPQDTHNDEESNSGQSAHASSIGGNRAHENHSTMSEILHGYEHPSSSESTDVTDRDSEDLISREFTGLSEDILTQLSPDRESNEPTSATTSTVLRPLQAPSVPPTFGLPPLPAGADANRPLGLFSGRFATPSSSEAASHVQSYGDTRQLLQLDPDTSSGANAYPMRLDRAPVTAKDFPPESDDSENLKGAEEHLALEVFTPAKKLRVTNPDPSSADSKNSIQRTPPSTERRNRIYSDSSFEFSSAFTSSPLNFHGDGKSSTDDATGPTVENLRLEAPQNPFANFDSVSTNTFDRRHGFPAPKSREHAFFDPEAVDGAVRTRSFDERESQEGSLADMSDEELSDVEQTDTEIRAIMEDEVDDEWTPGNRVSQADEWTTVRDPSQSTMGAPSSMSRMAGISSMADYPPTLPIQILPISSFQSHATATPQPTFSVPLAQAHCFGNNSVNSMHSFRSQVVQSPYEGQAQRQIYGSPEGYHSSPANSTGRQVQILQQYVSIPDDQLSPEPDDSPAQCDGTIDRGYRQGFQTPSPPWYAEPAHPEPVYYSPTRNIQQHGRQAMDLDIEMQDIRGHRVYRQQNGSQITRASVASQRGLQPLALQATHSHAMLSNQSLGTDRTRWSWLMARANRSSPKHSHVPRARRREDPRAVRLPTAAEVRRASTMSALQQTRMPNHSITADRQRLNAVRRASWLTIIFLGWFPPFAILMAFGWFDDFVRWISNGQVEHLPRWYRKFAYYLGVVHLSMWAIVFVSIMASY